MNARHLILALAASAPLLAQAPPQPAAQPPVFRAGTDLVEVEVITRDKSGIFVSDLALDDFELREDGKPYPVQQVYLRVAGANGWNDALRGSSAVASPAARVSAPPDAARRIFVVVFDDAHLSPGGFKRTQAAALTLFQSQLRDGDVGGVVANGRMANGRLTSDRAELIKAVKDAKPNAKVLSAQMDERLWPRLSEVEAIRIFVNDDKEMMDMATRRGCEEQKGACEGPAGDDPVRSMLHGKASQFSANVRVEATRTLAMLQSVLTGLGRLEGPKNVLLMSEGFISEETWPEVQDAVGGAARANTRIYALDARGLGRGMASVDSVAPTEGISRMFEQMDMGADSINSLAVDTGGFVVRNANQFDKAIAQIADDAGNYYVLGYLPPSPADGKFHRIGVKVKRQGVSVRARRGYTATPRPRPVMTATAAPAASPVVDASSARLPPSASLAEASGGGGKPDTTEEVNPDVINKPAAATINTSSTAASSGMRLRPDASKHINLLLPDPSADRAAAAGWEAYQRGDVHYALGLSEYALGEYASAVVSWEKVHQATSTFEPVYFDLVDGYLQLKQHDKSIRLLHEGAANWPRDPDIFNALGVVHTSRGALPDAIAAFKQAIDVAPNEAVSYFNLGRAFELRYFRNRRYIKQTQRWIADEKDRVAAIEQYERYLTFGGPYADAAREGVTRLKWAAPQ
jgi:VWFA-related protein